MSFRDAVQLVESMMAHRRPHSKGPDHKCAKCVLAFVIRGKRVRAGESALAAKNGGGAKVRGGK